MDQIDIKKFPCDLDHNGECLVCDCWPTDCAFHRWLNKDCMWETEEEMDNMFKDYDKKDYEDHLHGSNH